MSEVDDFVKRHPYGPEIEAKVPEEIARKPMRNFIPQHYYRAVELEAVINLAKERGYSDADRAKIRQILRPIEPALVSLDDIYGKEEE